MKVGIFVVICVVSLGLISCGSTAPCGLSQKTNKQDIFKQEERLVAEAYN